MTFTSACAAGGRDELHEDSKIRHHSVKLSSKQTAALAKEAARARAEELGLGPEEAAVPRLPRPRRRRPLKTCLGTRTRSPRERFYTIKLA